jgi:c(7)-type cytochrome triheme protein
MVRKGLLAVVLAVVVLSQADADTFGTKKRTPKPSEYGNVVIDNHAARDDSDPILFPHWLHRAKYTCRLCHVDLGFAMTAGETGITDADNRQGLYCGACHDGTEAFAQEETAENGDVIRHCARCHSGGKEVEFENEFYDFVADFPRSRFGNRVDWLKAEEQGLVELKDYLEGISIDRGSLQGPRASEIAVEAIGMPSIIFSHDKHTVWNGCELCHPQIFPIRKTENVYDMQDIFDGSFCGACHGSVAFPNTDCRLCHTEDVQ